MLNKPKYMTPSTNMQECVVDVANNSLSFSCIADGNEAIYAWRIRIYELKTNNKVYDTGKIAKSNEDVIPSLPFYPINEKNQNVVFQVDLNEYPSIGGATGFENSTEAYYWTIEFWNSVDSQNDRSGTSPTTISCEEVFYANEYPSVVLMYKSTNDTEYSEMPFYSAESIVLTSNEYCFKAKYTQAENIPLKRYGWRIICLNTGQILVDTISANQIYGTAENIICKCDKFTNDSEYSIEVYIETQNNVAIITTPLSFSVSYPTTFVTADFSTETLREEPAVINNWGEAKVMEGQASSEEVTYIDSYPIIENDVSAISIPQNEYITYNYNGTSNLDISEKSYIVLSTQLLDSADKVIFSAEGTDDYGNTVLRKLSFVDKKFQYIVTANGGDSKTEYYTPTFFSYPANRYKWFIFIMAPYLNDSKLLTVKEFGAVNGVYPSLKLFPSPKSYPNFGVWQSKTTEEV